MASEAEIAWAAGFFEGEGHFTIVKSHRRSGHPGYARMGLDNTDVEMLERFARIVGVGKVRPRRQRKPVNKPIADWIVGSRDGVRFVFALLRPWLSTRRLEQGNRVIVATDAPWERKIRPKGLRYRPQVPRSHCRRGHLFDAVNTEVGRDARGHPRRRCIECRRQYLQRIHG